jgi:hypothetical protein
VTANGALKLWRFEDVQLVRASGGFCVPHTQVSGAAWPLGFKPWF